MSEAIECFLRRNVPHKKDMIGRTTCSITIKIDRRYMIMLEFLSDYFGKKKTPLHVELSQAVINDVYERVKDNFDSELRQACERALREYESEVNDIYCASPEGLIEAMENEKNGFPEG